MFLFVWFKGIYMARLLAVLMFCVLCSSCMHLDVPAARIEFTSLEYDSGSYYLRFRSDRDLVNLYDAHGISAQVGTWVNCSLDGDTDFSILHHIQLSANGPVDEVRIVEGDRRYEFKAWFRFEEDENEGSSYRPIRKEVLLSLLKKQEYIPCMARITAFLYKAYYSKVMYIPTSRIIAEVEKEITAPEYVILPPEDRQLSWLLFEQICINETRYYAGTIIVHGGVCSGLPYSGLLSSFAPLTGQFQIVDSKTKQPRANVSYFIRRADGREEEGFSDEQGKTHIFGANQHESFKLFVSGDDVEGIGI
ncbi:hypothetical protein FQ192_19495 [Pseudomonas sp. ANT_J12]|uniref:hypothetical protein n=1 Tax=Pseudomonas sp. ANT_J12 TaxID=2597351 RepID=UPI0011F2E420|nr:hypothetical protein [Pseudomonas sp. ANT_J12]KAA0987658.1 hypothetical protein FQ192_19495 [Pseudomonas sp. ANT_J12]